MPTIHKSYYYFDDVCLSIDSLSCNSLEAIQSRQTIKNVNIYPNPFNNELNILNNNNEFYEIILYDLLSKKVLNQTFSSSTTVNAKLLSTGIYIYEMRNKNGIIQYGKMIKE